jgi:hypothetical protein
MRVVFGGVPDHSQDFGGCPRRVAFRRLQSRIDSLHRGSDR